MTRETAPIRFASRGSWVRVPSSPPHFKRGPSVADLLGMERDFSALVDQLVEQGQAAGGELRARREAAPRLDDAHTRELVDAYVAALRAAGWLTGVSAEQLETVLDVRVMTDDDGSVSLDVDSEVTGSVWGVPGWGTR